MAPWSADAANALIETLRAYPDGLEYFDRGYHDSGYYSAAVYAAEAQAQALAQFPQSHWAESWTWDQAYRRALVGGPIGVDLYGQLIGAGLNAGETDLAHLPAWFDAHGPETYLRLEIIAPPEPADPALGSLVAITDGGSAGFLWIAGLPETVTVHPLHSSSDFGFSSADSAAAEWRDVTGDGRPEILTSHIFVPGSLDALTTHFDIFEISGSAPRRLAFDPELPLSHGRTLTVLSDGGPRLQFRFVFDSFSCPFVYTQTYRWTGKGFTLESTEYPDADTIQATSDATCVDILVGVLVKDLHDGDRDVLPSLKRLLSAWPYSNEMWWPNEDGAADVRDRARFLIGLGLGLLSRSEDARAEIESMVLTPVVPESRWVAPGRAFLEAYQDDGDLAQACLQSGVCADLLQPKDLALIAARSGRPPAEILPALGLRVVAHGSIDLTGDGQPEDWAAVENGNSGTILFGFLKTLAPEVAVVLAYTASEGPRTVRVETVEPGHSVLIYDRDDGPVYQTLIWKDGELTLTYACTGLEHRVRSGYATLLEGGSAQAVLADLRGLESDLDERCRSPWDQRAYLIPRWLFVTALSAEWAQEPEEAAILYVRLWREFPNSAYALAARARLEPVP
ncbi:MAG: hypothetical protein JNL73_19030 [Anaerolineales bacterium]|nr:hypothetical protein [Anaerolineales bacterium]